MDESSAPALAAPLSVDRRSVRYWGEILFSRLLPSCLYGLWLAFRWPSVAGLVTEAVTASPTMSPYRWMYLCNQLLTTLYLGVLIVLFTVRLRRLAGQRHLSVILVAVFGSYGVIALAFIPSLVAALGSRLGGAYDSVLAALSPVLPNSELVLFFSTLISTAGILYSLWAIRYLGRSFSVLPEARRLVRTGPYSMHRHPLYIGEGVAAVALLMPYLGIAGMVILVATQVSQVVRIHYEEGVLTREFPEYAAYASAVPRYLPRPWLYRG